MFFSLNYVFFLMLLLFFLVCYCCCCVIFFFRVFCDKKVTKSLVYYFVMWLALLVCTCHSYRWLLSHSHIIAAANSVFILSLRCVVILLQLALVALYITGECSWWSFPYVYFLQTVIHSLFAVIQINSILFLLLVIYVVVSFCWQQEKKITRTPNLRTSQFKILSKGKEFLSRWSA